MVKNYPRLHPWATHWPINANQVPRRPERASDLSRLEMERWYQLSAFNQYRLILIGIDCIKTLIPNRRCDYVMGRRDTLLKTMSLTVQAGGNINLTVSSYWTLSLLCGHFLIYDICVLWWLVVTAEQMFAILCKDCRYKLTIMLNAFFSFLHEEVGHMRKFVTRTLSS